jgi:phosphatidylinositol-bisphosphatase
VNSNEYSTDEDARVPGWTDRILFAARNACDLEQVNYDCAINMFGSDHRPVFAQFLCAHEHEDLSQALAVVKGGTTSVCEIF